MGLPGGCEHSSEEKGQPSELDQVLYSREIPFVHLTSAGSVFMLGRVRGSVRLRRHSATGACQALGKVMCALVLGILVLGISERET